MSGCSAGSSIPDDVLAGVPSSADGHEAVFHQGVQAWVFLHQGVQESVFRDSAVQASVCRGWVCFHRQGSACVHYQGWGDCRDSGDFHHRDSACVHLGWDSAFLEWDACRHRDFHRRVCRHRDFLRRAACPHRRERDASWGHHLAKAQAASQLNNTARYLGALELTGPSLSLL
jgi:hypothetical protein